MPFPTVDDNHVTEGAALLTSRYFSAPVIAGLTTALMTRFQLYENAFWSLIEGVILANHPMPGGPWSILDQIGSIVDVPRNGMPDAQYVVAIQLEIRVLRSTGHPNDIIEIAQIVLPPPPNENVIAEPVVYCEWPEAAFEVWGYNVSTSVATILPPAIQQAKSSGTHGRFRYSTWAGNLVAFDTRVGTIELFAFPVSEPAAGFMDKISGQFPNAFASVQ